MLLLCLSSLGQSRIDSMRLRANSLGPDSLKVLTFIRLARDFNRINYDSALLYTKKAEKLSRQLGSEDFLGRSKYRKATVYIQKNELDLAKAELDTAILLLESSDNKQQLMGAKIGMGRLYQRRSDFDRAVTLFFEALPLAEEIKDRNSEARIKNYLASIYNYQKQYDLSIFYFQGALKLVEQLNFKPGISAVLTNLGDVYLTVEKYDSAIIYQRRALKIKRELGDKLGTGRVYNNLANVFVNSGSNLDSGIYYYENGLVLGKEINDKQLIALNLYGLVRSNFIKGDFRQAKGSSDELLKELDVIQDLSLASKSYDQIALVYAALGDVEKSLQFHSKGLKLSDSLLNTERIQLTNELEAKYQNETKQRAIDLLEAENQLQELQITKRQNERNGLIVLSVVVLLMLVLLVNQYRIKQAANKQLRELDQIKSTFFENLSHEFRTPLSLIIAPIKDRLKQHSGKDEEFFNRMLRNAESLDELIKQLLDLAKLEKGKYEMKQEVLEASRLFKVIAASYESLAVMNGIDFEIAIPDQEQWLELDQDLIKKICNNLLSNAFKFTPKQGSIRFKVSYNELLKIEVSDTGPGIPREDQHRIFDRFYQVEGPKSTGTGIGLALTKELVEAAAGKIVLESKHGEGTSFIVSLPIKVAVPQTLGQSEMAHKAEHQEIVVDPSFSPEKQNLLIIEDNADLRSYVSGLFTEDYNVYTATNGREGVKEAMETIPDLIISDIMMDEMDGLEVCQHLKSDQKTDHIPIVLLTARADQETKLTGLKHGADAYLLKPFESEELKAIAQNLVVQRQKLRDKYTESAAEKTSEPVTHPFIQKSEEIVQQYLSNESFSVDDFAREVGMSRMQLHRKLKAMTGLSATAFVRHHRLSKARRLLEQGEPVSQVAYAVGFSSLAYFTKSFKEQFGNVPSQIGKTVDQPID